MIRFWPIVLHALVWAAPLLAHEPVAQPADKAAEGADQEAGPMALWGGLHVGMSRAQVKARYPETKVILNASCRGRFKPVFQHGRLQAVRILQYLDYNDCGRELHSALMRRYGWPQGNGSVPYVALTGMGHTHDYYWHHEGRVIRLRLLSGGEFSELSYAPGFEHGAPRLGEDL